MKKNIYSAFMLPVLLFLSILTTQSITLHAESSMMGRMQFPKNISTIPMIRVCSSGKRIPYPLCEVNNISKQFTFSVPRFNNQKRFFLLITQAFDFKVAHLDNAGNTQNTIDYLKLSPEQPYKLYRLELIKTSSEKNESTSKTNKTEYRWQVKEQRVSPETGRIPDDTIIVRYNPFYVATLQGGSSFELPTIVLKENLLELAGSQDNLVDISNSLVLAALDSDTIHATMRQEIKHDEKRALVATTT